MIENYISLLCSFIRKKKTNKYEIERQTHTHIAIYWAAERCEFKENKQEQNMRKLINNKRQIKTFSSKKRSSNGAAAAAQWANRPTVSIKASSSSWGFRFFSLLVYTYTFSKYCPKRCCAMEIGCWLRLNIFTIVKNIHNSLLSWIKWWIKKRKRKTVGITKWDRLSNRLCTLSCSFFCFFFIQRHRQQHSIWNWISLKMPFNTVEVVSICVRLGINEDLMIFSKILETFSPEKTLHWWWP